MGVVIPGRLRQDGPMTTLFVAHDRPGVTVKGQEETAGAKIKYIETGIWANHTLLSSWRSCYLSRQLHVVDRAVFKGWEPGLRSEVFERLQRRLRADCRDTLHRKRDALIAALRA